MAKTIKQFLGACLLFAGLISVAGSAGDCDGKCMEYANSLPEMLMMIFFGLTMMVTGGIIILKSE